MSKKKPNQALKIQIPLLLVLKIISQLCFALIIWIRKHSNFFFLKIPPRVLICGQIPSENAAPGRKLVPCPLVPLAKVWPSCDANSPVCSCRWAISGLKSVCRGAAILSGRQWLCVGPVVHISDVLSYLIIPLFSSRTHRDHPHPGQVWICGLHYLCFSMNDGWSV